MDKQKLIGLVRDEVSSDHDLSGYEGDIAARCLGELLDRCQLSDGARDAYTRNLVWDWVCFIGTEEGIQGGSISEYAADAAVRAFAGTNIRLDSDEPLSRLQASVEALALYPEKIADELRKAGVIGEGLPYSRP